MQNGIKHLRKVKIWYRPDVNSYNLAYGGMKTFVDTMLEDFKTKNPDIDVELETVQDPEQALGDPVCSLSHHTEHFLLLLIVPPRAMAPSAQDTHARTHTHTHTHSASLA